MATIDLPVKDEADWDVKLNDSINAINNEVTEAAGDRSTLNKRISTISNFASPNAGGIVVGGYVDNAFQATNPTTVTGVADRTEMSPYYTSQRMRIDMIGVAVATAVTSSYGRCFIYGSSEDGWPDDLLYEGTEDLDFSTTGYKSHTLDFVFDSGRQYWVGMKHSGTAVLRAINISSCVNLGVASTAGSSNAYYTELRRNSQTFSDPMPASWNFAASDRSAGSPPAIRMRMAAL